MSSWVRGLLVGLVLGAAGCGGVQAWFGEPQADLSAPLRHAGDGVAFEYPGNWALREEPGEALQTFALESRGDALMLVQVFRPALEIDLDEHLALTMQTLVADFAARGGGMAEVEPGPVTSFERAWLGERRAARRASIRVAMPGEEADSAIELYAATLPDCAVLVFTMVPDVGRGQAAPGFDRVLDTFALQ